MICDSKLAAFKAALEASAIVREREAIALWLESLHEMPEEERLALLGNYHQWLADEIRSGEYVKPK